jgi:hypothetical protein
MESLIRTNLFLSRTEREGLQKRASKQGISSAELLRRILDSFLGIEAAPVETIKLSHEVLIVGDKFLTPSKKKAPLQEIGADWRPAKTMMRTLDTRCVSGRSDGGSGKSDGCEDADE